MENHPIELWDQLVCHSIYPTNLKNVLPDDGTIALLMDASRKASLVTRSYLRKEALLRKTDTEMGLLVGQYQSLFTELLNMVFNYLRGSDFSDEIRMVYEQVAGDLEALIGFLETSFHKYFDTSAAVPDFIRVKFEKSVGQELAGIRGKFLEQEHDRQLADAVFEIFGAFLKDTESVSIHQLNYFKNLVDSLSKWNAEFYRHPKFSPLIIMLIALRFNEDAFLFQVLRVIREEIEGCDSEEAQLILLKEFYKIISQVIEAGGEPFFAERPSAKESILDWLSQEIYFLETRYPKKENASAVTPSPKINTSLSVPVLAFYIRLFKESGIITNTNFQELFRAVSSTFTTHRKAEATHSHLHSKFYAIEESARRKVFDQLMEMAHLCKRIA